MTLLARTLSSAHHTLQTAARIIPPSRFASILNNFGKHTDFWACAAFATWGLGHGGRRGWDMYWYPPCKQQDQAIYKARKNSASPETGPKLREAVSKSPKVILPRIKSVSENLAENSYSALSAKNELDALPTGRTWGKPAGLIFFGCFFAVCAYSLRPIGDLNPLLARI